MTGISAIGVHLPRARLERSAIAAAMGWLTPDLPDQGRRTLAFWDEDSTTMGVAAARVALAQQDRAAFGSLDFCTLTPPFAERQNASILHAALGLPASCVTQESGTTQRAALIALHRLMEAGGRGLLVAADRPVNAPGSLAETRVGDGAAAAVAGPDDPCLGYLGGATRTDAIVDRYRAPGAQFATEGEERWLRDVGWQGIVGATIAEALGNSRTDPDAVDHLVLASTLPRLAQRVAREAGLGKARLADDLGGEIGETGTAHALMMLAAHMPKIAPGDTVLLAGFGQGATALVFRATEAISGLDTGFETAHAAGLSETCYTKLPVFSGLLPWDQGPRGRAPVMDALATAQRYAPALLSFTGGKCRETGAVQFPPARLSANPQAPLRDTQEPWPMADLGGTVTSRTADNLAFSRNPPSVYGLVDIAGGGRLMMDFTDPDAATLRIGDPVRFVFRVKDIDSATGFRRYFWKAVTAQTAPVQERQEARDAEWA